MGSSSIFLIIAYSFVMMLSASEMDASTARLGRQPFQVGSQLQFNTPDNEPRDIEELQGTPFFEEIYRRTQRKSDGEDSDSIWCPPGQVYDSYSETCRYANQRQPYL
ncbi:unnamed protein product [Orchesella dallaii]|uniref:Uncharacterized protein n=1 Tax=Orchesella dallaii TaxID=48710 RepID=A0ABP1QDQ6_9HEXA